MFRKSYGPSRGPRRHGRSSHHASPHSRRENSYSKFISKVKELQKEEVYVPKHKFHDFDIDAKLKQNIINKGYENPTPIQDQTIPYILQGKDLIGLANTGTGKTAAFLIPMIHKVLKDRSQKVLIMAPTRELAQQIEDQLKIFTKFLNIWSVMCIGGASMGKQIMLLKRRPNFVIGTPGRLKDLIQRRLLNLPEFKNVVLDEVDRMFDMGFIADIKYLLGLVSKPRQSLFFSATLSKEIDGLVQSFLHNPVTVSVKSRETAANVDQDIVRFKNPTEKLEKLHEILIKPECTRVLIFARTKAGVVRLAHQLHDRGFKVDTIHGDKTQFRRQRALADFKASVVNILIATDVAARGLDISGVSHVINYDVPATYDDYVHRIGRTGRANKMGVALTFVD